jgi:flagellar protein FliO/FliZ
MNPAVEIWPAFFKTSMMLCFVLALLVLVFYLLRRFSTARGIKGSDRFIRTLCVHHLSPKEKLVLLDVLGKKILIGVTPQTITKLSSIETESGCGIDSVDNSSSDLNKNRQKYSSGFSGFLTKALNPGSVGKQGGSSGENG